MAHGERKLNIFKKGFSRYCKLMLMLDDCEGQCGGAASLQGMFLVVKCSRFLAV